MKVFSVVGYTKSGKTTTIEKVIKELKKRNYSVGTVKDIHYEDFAMDKEGTNTYRHREAGADLVTARGLHETDVIYSEKLDIKEILKYYDQDYVILEGLSDIIAPKIVTGKNPQEVDEKMDYSTFLISGVISDEIDDYKGIKAISANDNIEALVDYIEENVFELLPNFDAKCCNSCGYSCKKMCEMIIKGEKTREDCVLKNDNIELKIDGKEIRMVPFVQRILRNTLSGLVQELHGYKGNSHIEIELGYDNEKSNKIN